MKLQQLPQVLFALILICQTAMAQPTLTRPMVVPEFCNGLVKYYKVGSPTVADAAFTLDVGALCGGGGKPNSVALNGNDLYVNLNAGCGRLYKYTNYLTLGNAAVSSLVTNIANDYVGIAFNGGNMYTTEGDYGNNQLVEYSGAGFATRTVLGNAGVTSYLANIAFDAAGNVWVSDYNNDRIVVYKSDGTYRILGNYVNFNSIPVGNTTMALNTATNQVFDEPEGIAFDATGNLWVGNNTDNGANTRGSIVKLAPTLLNAVLALSASGIKTLISTDNSANGFTIYNLPNPATGNSNCFGVGVVARAQCGGLVIDKVANQLYVNEEQGNQGLKFSLSSIAAITDVYNTYALAITSTNPGNGGIALDLMTVLPVELLTFKGSPQYNGIQLTWATASENGTARFDIERSADGQTFEKIGEQKALGKTDAYSFLDKNSLSAVGYYRLKINDFDGQTAFSKVVSVTTKGNTHPLSIFPNPAEKTLTIQLNAAKEVPSLLTLTDLLGKPVWSKRLDLHTGFNQLTLDLPPLASGVYLLRIGDVTQRLMIR